MRRLQATCLALALRASFMFADREPKPVAGVIEYAPPPALEPAGPNQTALIVQLRPRLASPRLVSGAIATIAFARAA